MLEKADRRTEKRKIGDSGEKIAETFLVKRGFRVIQRNFLRKCGEIDIICENSGKLCFIEVKTVSRETADISKGDSYRPEDNIHPQKIARMERAINVYLSETEFDGDWEIAVVAIELIQDVKQAKVRFLRNFAW